MLKNFILILCVSFSLPLISVQQEPSRNDITFMHWCYEQLWAVSYRNETGPDDVMRAIESYKAEYPEAFEVQTWYVSDDQAVNVTMLDLGLISLRCQEEVLNLFVTHGQDLAELKQEFDGYEREKLLVDMLRRAGVEQQLMQAEIAHYAQVMLDAWIAAIGLDK